MVLTQRDRQVLAFLARYRFCTREHLLKARFFPSEETCVRRLNMLKAAKYLRAGTLGRTRYYYLAPAGGLAAGLADLDTARRYRDSPKETVVRHLVWADFALAKGINYLQPEDAVEVLRAAGANLTTIRLLTGRWMRLYQWQGELHVLLVDTGQGNFPRRVKDLARLPPTFFHLDILIFNPARQTQLERILAGRAKRATIIVSTWKY